MRFASALLLSTATTAVLASEWPHYVEDVSVDTAIGSADDVTAPARVYVGTSHVYTLTGENLQAGDRVFFTENDDCLTENNVATLDGDLTVELTIDTAGSYALCYQNVNSALVEAGETPKPFNYYGNAFTVEVVSLDSFPDTEPYELQALTMTATGSGLREGDVIRVIATADGALDCTDTGQRAFEATVDEDGMITTAFEDGDAALSITGTCIQLSGTGEWHDAGIEWNVIENDAGAGEPLDKHIVLTIPHYCVENCANQDVRFYGRHVRSGDQVLIFNDGEMPGSLSIDSTNCADAFTDLATGTYTFDGSTDLVSTSNNLLVLELEDENAPFGGYAAATIGSEGILDNAGEATNAKNENQNFCILPVGYTGDAWENDAADSYVLDGISFLQTTDAEDDGSANYMIYPDSYMNGYIFQDPNSPYFIDGFYVDNSGTSFDIYTAETSATYWLFAEPNVNKLAALAPGASDCVESDVEMEADGTNIFIDSALSPTFTINPSRFKIDGANTVTSASICTKVDVTLIGGTPVVDLTYIENPSLADYTVAVPKLFKADTPMPIAIQNEADDFLASLTTDGGHTVTVYVQATPPTSAADCATYDAELIAGVDDATTIVAEADEDVGFSWAYDTEDWTDDVTPAENMVGSVGFCASLDSAEPVPLDLTVEVVDVMTYPEAGPVISETLGGGKLTFADFPSTASTFRIALDCATLVEADAEDAADFADVVSIDATFTEAEETDPQSICAYDSSGSWVNVGSYTIGATAALGWGTVATYSGQAIDMIDGDDVIDGNFMPDDTLAVYAAPGTIDDCDGTVVATVETSVESGVEATFSAFTLVEPTKVAVFGWTQAATGVCVEYDTGIRVAQVDSYTLAEDTNTFGVVGTGVTFELVSDSDTLDNADELMLIPSADACEDIETAGTALVAGDVAYTLPAAGGEMALCYNAGGAGFFDTGLTFNTVKFTDFFPESVVETFAHTVFIQGEGLAAGDSVALVNAADCTAADVEDLQAGVVAVELESFDAETNLSIVSFSTTQAASSADASICYQSNVFALETEATAAAGNWVATGLTLGTAAADTNTDYEGYSPATSASKIGLYDQTSASFTLTAATEPATEGDKFRVLTTGSDCTSATDIAANMVGEAVATDLIFDTLTIEMSLPASNSAYVLCTQSAHLTADDEWTTGAVNVRVSLLETIDPNWTVSTTTVTSLDATITGLSLLDEDMLAIGTMSDDDELDAVEYAISEVNTNANGKTESTILIDQSVVDEKLAGGEHSIFYNPNGSGYVDTGVTFQVISVSVCPTKVITTANGATRTIAVSGEFTDALDQIFFAPVSCASGASQGVAVGSDGEVSVAFDTAATNYVVCFRSTRNGDAVAQDDEFVRITGINVATSAQAVTHSPKRIVSGVATEITFTGTVQAGDLAKAIEEGDACDGVDNGTVDNTPTTVGEQITIADKCDASGVITLDAAELGTTHPSVCYQGADQAGFTTITDDDVGSAPQALEVARLTAFEPMTINADNAEELTFSGEFIIPGDFASFVANYYDTCDKAWVYEQALASDNTAWFQLPAGLYNTCYWHKDTITGYNMYAMDLEVKAISAISPTWTSANRVTDFYLTSASEEAPLTASDMIGFVPSTAMCSMATSATYTANAKNVVVEADGDFLADNIVLSSAGTWTLCADFAGSAGWAATLDSAVEVFEFPQVGTIDPTHVVVDMEDDLTFTGSYLGNDKVAFIGSASNLTCNNDTISTTGLALSAPLVAAENINSLTATFAEMGSLDVCYQYAKRSPSSNPSNPDGEHGLVLHVVDVTAVSPTSVEPTSTTEEATLTLSGYFGAAPGDNWAAFVDSMDEDCSAAAMSADKQYLAVAEGAMSASAMFNFTDAAGDYKLCIKFTGRDEWILYDDIEVSSRQITAVAPTSIVNDVDGMVQFIGAGIRDGDYASFINATDASLSCTDGNTNTSAVVVTNAMATFNLPSGSYKLCYKFGAFEWASVQGASLLVQPAKVTAVTPAQVAVGSSVTFGLTGTGIGAGDLARLIFNATGDCATSAGSSTSTVSGSAVDGYTFSLGPELEVGTYTLCYKLGDAEWTTFPSVVVKGTARPASVGGSFPRKAMATGAASVSIFGYSLTALDQAIFTKAATCTGLTASPIVFSKDSTVVSITQTFAETGRYTLCYKHGSSAMKRYSGVTMTISDFNAANCADGEFMCDGICQAESCAPAAGCTDASQFLCTGTGVCARTPAECPPVDDNCSGLVCPGGECVDSLAECPTSPACPQTHLRCLDGSCASKATGCVFKTAAIAAPTCAGVVSEAHGICYATGTTVLPPFEGCLPSTPYRCGNCECAATAAECPKQGNMHVCLDGSLASSADKCVCPDDETVASGSFKVGAGAATPARRFVVKANAETSVTLNGKMGGVATLSLPANSIAEDACILSYGPVAGSVAKAAAASQDVKLASPAINLSLMSNGNACTMTSTASLKFAAPVKPAAPSSGPSGSGSMGSGSMGSGSGSMGSGSSNSTGSGSGPAGSVAPPTETSISCIAVLAGQSHPTIGSMGECMFSSSLTSAAVSIGEPTGAGIGGGDEEEEGSGSEEEEGSNSEEEEGSNSEEEEGSSSEEEEGSSSEEEEGSGSEEEADSASTVAVSAVVVLATIAASLL